MKVIYLDGCATTRVDDEVFDAMLPYLREEFGNPSSPHVLGKRARRAVDEAAESVARLIGADPADVVFTSGATESNNLALLGMFGHDERAPVNGFFCPIDHKSSLAVGQALAARGVETRTARVRPSGQVDLDDLAARLDLHTRVATAAWVNSEIGVVQPVAAMAALCHAVGAMLHADAAQAAGRIPIAVREAELDTLSLSAHKIHGPKGVGALYVRPEIRHRLRPVLYGGGQHALRSGTIPTHLVVGMGKAAELAAARLDTEWRRVRELRATALDVLAAGVPGLRVNGDPDASVPHVLNVVLPGVRGESLVAGLRTVAVSTGSACNSGSQEPSYVLTAIGVPAEDANCSVRICLDPAMSFADLVLGVELLVERARALAGVAVATPGQV
ncbi:cysteine desulfurase [Actinomadura sp. ATCC 31491]|uniref:Cysteine desulfurase n=1 Tax=Actinomadura luzonensis TaxID=2805427 RepID=A0ABT0FVL8_9ACTN|nr:cysteine desulfurase family protein [Actinomadura luzonensis]MCK2216228.1 cysteine desulfurase [Actinomadura luzonensis]